MGIFRAFLVALGLGLGPRRRRALARAAGVMLVLVVEAPALVQAMPTRTGWVTDEAGALSPQERQDLDRELDSFARKTSFEVAVVAVRSLEGKSVEEYSFELAQGWKVGKAGLDSGVLVIVAVGDHKMRIETGKGVGGQLTDLESRDILDRVMKPRLQASDTAGALRDGARAVMARLEPSFAPSPAVLAPTSDHGVGPTAARPGGPPLEEPPWPRIVGGLVLVLALGLVGKAASMLLRWRQKRAQMESELRFSTVAADELPRKEDFDALLARLGEPPWSERGELVGCIREAYEKIRDRAMAECQLAIVRRESGTVAERLVQANIARDHFNHARFALARLRETVEDRRIPGFADTFAQRAQAQALLGTGSAPWNLESGALFRQGEESLAEAFFEVGRLDRSGGMALAQAHRNFNAIVADWHAQAAAAGSQAARLAALRASLAGVEVEKIVARLRNEYQQFCRDFPNEECHFFPEYLQTDLDRVREAIQSAQEASELHSRQGAEEFLLQISRAETALDYAQNTNRWPFDFVESREDRKKTARQMAPQVDSLLALLRALPAPPEDVIADATSLLASAREQLALGPQGNFARALREATSARDLCTDFTARAREAASLAARLSPAVSGPSPGNSPVVTSSPSPGASPAVAIYQDNAPSIYGSSSNSGSGSSSGGGDFGGGGSSSDW